MKKIIISTLVAITSMIFASSVSAGMFQPYLGVGAGASVYGTGVTDLTGTAERDESDGYGRLMVGIEFNKYVSLEFTLANLGESLLKGNFGDTYKDEDGWIYNIPADDYELMIKTRTATMGGVFYIPVGKGGNSRFSFAPFVKLGLHSWEMDIRESGISIPTIDSRDDGVDLYIGGGGAFNLGPHFTLRVDLEAYGIDDDNGYVGGIGLFGVNTLFKF